MIDDGLNTILKSYKESLKLVSSAFEGLAISSVLSQISYSNKILQSMQAIQPNNIKELTKLMGLANELTPFYSSMELQRSLSVMASITKPLVSDAWFSTATHLQNTMSLINKVITPEITSALSSLKNIKLPSLDISDFNLNEITFCDDKIIYDGVEYEEENLREECEKEIEEIKQGNPIENIRKKYWIIFLIFSILWNFPQIENEIDFYKNVPKQIEHFVKTNILGEAEYLNVIKEKAVIRKEANSKSAIIVEITYAEPLEIIDKVPYWYKVKYVSGENEFIGWVSKISIGTEDNINE